MHCKAIAHSGRLKGQADAGSVALRTLFKTELGAPWKLAALLVLKKSLLGRPISSLEKKEGIKDTTKLFFLSH